MRFASLLTFPLILLVLGGCSSGSRLAIPYPDREVSGESLVIVSKAIGYELSNEVPFNGQVSPRIPSARELVASVFEFGSNTADRYETAFFDGLHATLEKELDFDNVEIGTLDDSVVVSETRVMMWKLSRSGVLDPYTDVLVLPELGYRFEFSDTRPDYVILLMALDINTQVDWPRGGIPKPYIVHKARFVVWDNRKGEPFSGGSLNGWGGEKGPMFREELNQESFEVSVRGFAHDLIRVGHLETK